MVEQSPEERFLVDIYALDSFNVWTTDFFYPYIVVREKSGTFQKITLQEAIKTALDNLPCIKDRKDEEPKPKFKIALVLRYGLLGESPKTLREIGAELGGISRQMAFYMLFKARHAIRKKSIDIFEQFLVPSPEKLLELKERAAEAESLHKKIADSYGELEITRPYLSTRVFNNLFRTFRLFGLDLKLGTLLRMSEEELLNIRGFGPKSVVEIYKALKTMDLLQYSRLNDYSVE